MKRIFVTIECDCCNCTNDTMFYKSNNFCKIDDELNKKIENAINLKEDTSFYFTGIPSNMKTARKLAKILGFKRIKKRDICPVCYKKFKNGELNL